MIPQRHAIRELAHVRIKHSLKIATADIRDSRNIVMLCRHHHDAIDVYRILRSNLRDCLTENELMHIRNVAGPEWLDEHYPSTNGGHHGQS